MIHVKVWFEDGISIRVTNSGYQEVITVAWRLNNTDSITYSLKNGYGTTFSIPNATSDEKMDEIIESITLNNIGMFDDNCKIMAAVEYANGTMDRYKNLMYAFNPLCVNLGKIMQMLSNEKGESQNMVQCFVHNKGNLVIPGFVPTTQPLASTSTKQPLFMRNIATKEQTVYFEYGRKRASTEKVEKFAYVVRGGKVMGSLQEKNNTQVYIPVSNWSYCGSVDPCVTSEVEYWDWECSGSGPFAIEIHDAFALLSLAGQGGWEQFSTAESKNVFAITKTLPDGVHWFEYNFDYPDGVLFLLFGKQLRICDRCKEYVSIGYHCTMCMNGDFDMCISCYGKYGHDQSHAIDLFGKPLRVCDVCKCSTWAGYHCPVCVGGDFDVCYSCYMKYGHDKSHAIQLFGKPLRMCDICQCQTHAGYHCPVCEGGEFSLCYACYTKYGHDKSHAICKFGRPLRACNACKNFTSAGYYCTTCEGFNVCYTCYVNHEHESSHEIHSF